MPRFYRELFQGQRLKIRLRFKVKRRVAVGCELRRSGKALEDFYVASPMTAERGDLIRLRIRDTAPDQLEKRGFAHTDILQSRERSAGKDLLARSTVPRNFKHDCVG